MEASQNSRAIMKHAYASLLSRDMIPIVERVIKAEAASSCMKDEPGPFESLVHSLHDVLTVSHIEKVCAVHFASFACISSCTNVIRAHTGSKRTLINVRFRVLRSCAHWYILTLTKVDKFLGLYVHLRSSFIVYTTRWRCRTSRRYVHCISKFSLLYLFISKGSERLVYY